MLYRLMALSGLMVLAVASCSGQWATGVLEYAFGTGQTGGQSSAWFPENVLGPVAASATATTPAFLPQDVVSLGRNGYVALSFDAPIVDGPGPDFIVFENAFLWGDDQIFDEWMTVSVSEDGTVWVPFPCDTLTGEGMAGRTPTYAATSWTDPAVCGGDAFDLAAVGLAQARYVRVQDATRYQPADRLAAELDAVAVIHSLTGNDPAAKGYTTSHTENNILTISSLTKGTFTLFTLEGRILDTRFLPSGSLQVLVPGHGMVVCCFVPEDGSAPVWAKQWIP